jgi:hypothetical protein
LNICRIVNKPQGNKGRKAIISPSALCFFAVKKPGLKKVKKWPFKVYLPHRLLGLWSGTIDYQFKYIGKIQNGSPNLIGLPFLYFQIKF